MRAVIAALVLVTGTALAQPTAARSDERAWHMGIEAATDFPLYVGAQVWLEMPYRFRVTVSTGEQPDAYLQTINSVAVSSGAYNQAIASFITELIDRAV